MLATAKLLLVIVVRLEIGLSGCLPNAIPVEERRNVSSNVTTSRSVGVWNIYGGKFQTDTPTAVFQILAEEMLGYHVVVDAKNTGSMIDALYGLAGCEEPENASYRSCQGQTTRHHVSIGLHLTGNQTLAHWRSIQRFKRGGMLESLGTAGFASQSGLQISGATLLKGQQAAEPLFLDDFRSYNSQLFSPEVFFRRFTEIDEQLLIPCSEWRLDAAERLVSYVWQTGDTDGVVGKGEALRCLGRWWLAPSCRASRRCIPCITGANDYGVAFHAVEIMQKAALWQMPLALGAAPQNGSSVFRRIILEYDVLWMFWEPSVELQDISPIFIRFPSYNFTQWSFYMMASARRPEYPEHVVSLELAELAPEVRVMLQRTRFSVEDINAMIQWSDMYLDLDPCWDCAARAGACNWLLQNEDKWKPWIPKKSQCFSGQGMYDDVLGEFIFLRGPETSCRACTAGRFSATVEDAMGHTAECRLCRTGTAQPSASSVKCDPCVRGRYSSSEGLSECFRCERGRFMEEHGASQCVECPDGMTTDMVGAEELRECRCNEGWYWMNSTLSCIECPMGMSCAGGQSLPEQLPGYWAEASRSNPSAFSVFQCRDQLQCPGGDVGSCPAGRIGRACGSCRDSFAAELNGECSKCTGRSYWPIFLMLSGVCLILPIVIAAGIFMTRARRAALSIFMVSIIFGQVVVCLQGLDAIYQLDLRWIDPAKAILQSLAIFSLDLDLSCVLPPQEYVLEYVVELIAYPITLAVTFLMWFSLRFAKPISFNAFINVHGVILVALLTAITLTLVRPLQCRSNPNGLFTIVSKPYIICWQGEHGTLVMLTVSGILAYPVTILAAITYLTRQYPIWLRSGGGIEVMERYRFLFARFRPERYYYGLILTAHNLLVAIIPAALVALPALQVGIMGIVICLKLIVQILLWPWRLDLANYNDLALSAGLLILLLLASPLLNISQEETLSFVAILLSCVMVLLPLVAVLAASAVVFTRLRPQSKYDAFLCHHKAGAGALCRFFKLVAKKYMKINIFLDSDELDDLGRIFDVVRADVKCLVVVLTTELLHRMWCAGEITTAHKNDVRIIPLYCDGYAFPTNESIDVIESVWTEEQRSTLVSYGISMEDVKEAYLDVQKLKGVALCRSWALEEQEEKILEIISESSRFCSPLSRHKVPRGSIEGAKILVCTSLLPEATSTGMILQQMVQLRMRTSTYSLHTAEDLLPANASFVLFVLSKGVLEDPHFARCLLTSRQKSLEFITVNDGTFQFPQPDFATEVETGRHLLPGLSPNVGPLLAKAYQVLLSILALPLTPHGSSGLLERQVAQICQRLGTLEDGPRKKDGLSSQLGDASFAFESEVSEGKALDRSEVVERESVRSTCSVNSDELWHV